MQFRFLKDELLNFINKRISYATVFIGVVALFLFGRLFYLQVIMYDNFLQLSNSNRIRTVSIPSERGFIYDKNGKILVKNTPTYQLEVIKEDVLNVDELLEKVNKNIILDKEKAKSLIRKSSYYQPSVIARGLTFEQITYFLEHNDDYHGLEVGLQSTREYIDGISLSHIIGYLGEASLDDLGMNITNQFGVIGKSGIERYYERFLQGIDGKKQIQVNSFGRVVNIVNEEKSIAGSDIYLTIDYDLQKYITELLIGRRGSVVLLDITDNSVVAMVSAPTFDLRLFSLFILDSDWKSLIRDKDKPLINRAIEGVYPPGSVYKIIMALAGLKEGVITPDTKFKCTGIFSLSKNFNYACWKKGGHGDVNLRKALSESCDVYFYNLGRLLEIDKIQEYSNLFSLGRQTGIDLPNERSGFFPSKKWKQDMRNEKWFPGETVITSIGQGYMVTTPLQIAVMVSGVFNGGHIYKPRLVNKIVSNVDNSTVSIEPEESGRLEISETMKEAIMAGLVDAVYVPGGTSRLAAVREISIGGKTGTAQVVSLRKTELMKKKDIPEEWRDHSWFAGIFPANKPRYAIVVMIENGGSGGKSAAPLAGEVIKTMLSLGYVKKN